MPEYFPLLVLNHYADKKKGILLFQYLFEWGEATVWLCLNTRLWVK
jgi:hypothetical protein